MRAVIAIDSFKGSLTSLEAGEAAKAGVLAADSAHSAAVFPLADGGEGTVEAIVFGSDARLQRVEVSDPLGRPVLAEYAVTETGVTVVETASCAGLTQVKKEERNPLYTTSYGLGELIAHAVKNGARELIVGLGGSATNDGGVGMLSALGYRFLDKNGKEIRRGALGLKDLCSIDDSGVLQELRECNFTLACDVKNPLLGAQGCSAVYGPQKGATAESVRQMDEWLQNFAALTKRIFSTADEQAAGAGAAGGLGYAFLVYLNAKMRSGAELVAEATGLEQAIANSDLVLTGEGRMDGQSGMGKAPVFVASLARKYGKPVIALCGSVGEDVEACNVAGIDGVFSILRSPCSLEAAMDKSQAQANMRAVARQVVRLVKAIQ